MLLSQRLSHKSEKMWQCHVETYLLCIYKDRFYQETSHIESVVNILLNDSATALSHVHAYKHMEK